MAVEDERGPVGKPRRIACRDEAAIVKAFRSLRPFRAVIEASSSYRWLYDLLDALGTVVLAHPLRLRAIVTARAKTDKLDAALLEQKKTGGDPEICTIYHYMFFLFEQDDKKIRELREKCKTGGIICGDCKAMLSKLVAVFLQGHQKRREKAKDVVGEYLLTGKTWAKAKNF